MNETPSFFDLFSGKKTVTFLGAGDPISALMAAQSGAEALWASSFCISTLKGLRDLSELSLKELADTVFEMTAHHQAPILVDGDSGFGSPQGLLRLAHLLIRSGARGLCIEDKPFPKANSHFGMPQSLVAPEEFCSKLVSIKAAFGDSLYLVARTESFTAKLSLEEALKRCWKYAESGADAVCFTARDWNIPLIEDFLRYWNQPDKPLIFIPPPKESISNETLFQMGFRGVIWANQAMRASLKVYQETYSELVKSGSSQTRLDQLLSMDDIFKMLGYDCFSATNLHNQTPPHVET